MRHRPERPWPPYAYLPGHHPHPVRDPRGHLHGAVEDWGPPPTPEQWARSEAYLWAVDLYNHGFHWEAHEVWEALWLRARDSMQSEFLRALVQAAAAAVQARMGHGEGCRRLCRRAAERLRKVASARGSWYMGVELPAFALALESLAETEEGPGSPSRAPQLVLEREPGNPSSPIG